jgi:hypothetical protein
MASFATVTGAGVAAGELTERRPGQAVHAILRKASVSPLDRCLDEGRLGDVRLTTGAVAPWWRTLCTYGVASPYPVNGSRGTVTVQEGFDLHDSRVIHGGSRLA